MIVKGNTVYWKEIGYYSDYDEGFENGFRKVREYAFSLKNYHDFIDKLRLYKTDENGK